MRALLGAASLASLVGCATPADGPALPSQEAVAAALPEAAVPAGAGAGARAHAVELGASCTGPAGVTVRYPGGWVTGSAGATPACSMFSADDFPVVPASDVRTAPIVLDVEDVPFDVAAAPLPEETGRSLETVDGVPAVRMESVAGPGLWPEGTALVRWVVDLGEQVLVADAVGLPPFDHAGDVEVLDAMVRSLALGEVLRDQPSSM